MAVQFKFTGDDKDVSRALERMEKKYNALIATTKKGADETKKMADAATKAFESTRTPQERYIKKMAEINELVKKGAIDQDTFRRAAKGAADELAKADRSGGGLAKQAFEAARSYGGVLAAITAINAGLEKTVKLNAQANAKQLSVGDAQSKFMRNLGNATPADRQALVQQTMALATRNKQDPAETYMIAAEALSTGAKPMDALKAVDIAQRLVPENGAMGERSTMAGSIVDVGKLTGSSDMMANAGLIAAMGQAARVSSMEMTNKNLVPALGTMQARGGGTTQQNAAILAALTQTGDVTGATSGTAGAQLAEQLLEFYPEFDTEGKPDEHGRRKITKGTGLKSTLERLRNLQGNKAEGNMFLARSSFEVKAMGGIAGLIEGGGNPIAAALDENLQAMPSIDKAGAYAENIIQGFGSTEAGALSAMGRATESSKSTLDLSNAKAAYTDEVRKRLADLTERTHGAVSGPIVRKKFDFDTALGSDPAATFDSIMNPTVRNLEGKQNVLPFLDTQIFGAPSEQDKLLIEEIKKLSETNRESAATLKQIQANQRARGGNQHAE